MFGHSEFVLRIPSVIFGTLTIYLTYLIAGRISKNRIFSLLSVALIAASQFHIYYSQEARMYIMAAFFASLAVYSFLYILENARVLRYWVTYSIALSVMMFSDFVPVFVLPVFWIYPVFRAKNRSWWLKFFVVHLPLVVLGIVYLPIFSMQLESGRWLIANFPTWQSVAGGATFKQAALVWIKFVFGRLTLASKPLYYTLSVIASIPIAFSLVKAVFKRPKEFDLLWLWLLLPLLLGFVASFFFPAFIYFRFTFILPAFYLLTAWGILQIREKRFSYVIIAWIILDNILGIGIYYLNKNTQREDWKSAVAFVEQSATEADLVVFEFPDPFAPYKWYSGGVVAAEGVTDSIYANPEKTKEKTLNAVREKNGVYYFEYLIELSDPQDVVRLTIKEEGFKEDRVYNFSGVGFVYYYTR
jgi:4-amino-4-deoxy-L-arabinose transferase-like glycosyltransferase